MKASYKKLWKVLIDKDMTKTDLRNAIGVSSATIAKMTRGEDISMAVIMKICKLFQCDVGDIMEVVSESAKTSKKVKAKCG